MHPDGGFIILGISKVLKGNPLDPLFLLVPILSGTAAKSACARARLFPPVLDHAGA